MTTGSGGAVQITDSSGRNVDATEHGEIKTSTLSIIFYDQFDGNAINTNTWSSSQSGMTQAQSGFLTLNNAGAVTANAYSILTSNKIVPFYGEQVVEANMSIKVSSIPDANTVIEFGFGAVSGNSAPTDGAFYRITNGQIVAVTSYGGAETVSQPFSGFVAGMVYNCEIQVDSTGVDFNIDELAELQQLEAVIGNPFPISATRQPLFFRVYNGASPPGVAVKLLLGRIEVTQALITVNKPWPEVLAEIGRGSYQSPVANFGTTCNRGNSTAPAAASLSNTVPSYTTIDGQFKVAAVVAAETDYALFGFQVPAGYQFKITGVAIDSYLQGAAIVTPTTLEWAIGLNSTAASLATVDGTGTVAPRRKPLGVQTFIALAGIGSEAQEISRSYNPPLVVDSGRYFHVILRIPDGAATLNLVYRGIVSVHGFFE